MLKLWIINQLENGYTRVDELDALADGQVWEHSKCAGDAVVLAETEQEARAKFERVVGLN